MTDPSVVRFRGVVAAACAELDSRRQELNDLNVFPVADGDTGDNMAMTLRAVLSELDRLNGQHIDEIGREEVVAAVARAALLGARGNSGVILSQIVRGAAAELASRPGELIDPVLVSAALARAADAAYESVREPAEGTMLSAVRAMAHRVAQDLAHMERPRLGPEAAPAEQDRLLAEVLEGALEAGREAVRRGPEQLSVLRDSGVVDAGAYGLVAMIAGVISALRGGHRPQLPHEVPSRPVHASGHTSSRYRFCTSFAVTGHGLEARPFVPRLEQIGDSVLVVGDERTLKVHVHTDEPDAAMALFARAGEVSNVDLADMRAQVADRAERLAASAAAARAADPSAGMGAWDGAEGARTPAEAARAACGVVAVAMGAGLKRLYEQLGARVVEGEAGDEPVAEDLLAALRDVEADEVILLRNGASPQVAARAGELADRPVHPVPTAAPQQGLGALIAFDPQRSGAENAETVGEAAAGVATGHVAPAGAEAVGYAGGLEVARGTPAEVLRATIARLAEGRELVTCLSGADAPLSAEEVRASAPPGVELDLHAGGQPRQWWLLGAE